MLTLVKEIGTKVARKQKVVDTGSPLPQPEEVLPHVNDLSPKAASSGSNELPQPADKIRPIQEYAQEHPGPLSKEPRCLTTGPLSSRAETLPQKARSRLPPQPLQEIPDPWARHERTTRVIKAKQTLRAACQDLRATMRENDDLVVAPEIKVLERRIANITWRNLKEDVDRWYDSYDSVEKHLYILRKTTLMVGPSVHDRGSRREAMWM
jgi:hypothetical protein